jgi:hypothetical protein
MNGKGLLVVVLAAVAGILAKSTFDRAPAGGGHGHVGDGDDDDPDERLLLGIERDPVLSHVAGTKAGAITPSLGLVARLVGYVVIPLGGLIGSRLGAPGAVISIFKDLANTLNR